MNFQNAKVGERYNIWVRCDTLAPTYLYEADYSFDPECRKLSCTVVGLFEPSDDGEIIIGWMAGELSCPNTFDRATMLEVYATLLQEGYNAGNCTKFRSCSATRWAELIGGSDSKIVYPGASCSKCKDFNQFAQSNQDDGTFLCYTCRG